MLVSPHTYQQLHESHKDPRAGTFRPLQSVGWSVSLAATNRRQKMLLVHQVGSVRVGEVVRSVSCSGCHQSVGTNVVQIHSYIYAVARPNSTVSVILTRED